MRNENVIHHDACQANKQMKKWCYIIGKNFRKLKIWQNTTTNE